jgi:endonuclease/exonuclease/phosphatase family metal-dependent hydrolase
VLRVVSYNIHGLRDDRNALIEAVGALAPDVLVLQEGPRRLRWRNRCARLAADLGMVYVGGGAPALGNVILSTLRVTVQDTWDLRYPLTPGRHMRGATFARCAVGGVSFVVAGSHLATDPTERPAQARLLKQALTDLDHGPVASPGGGAPVAAGPPEPGTDPAADPPAGMAGVAAPAAAVPGAAGGWLGTGGPPVILAVDLNETADGDSWRLLADGLIDAAGTTPDSTFPAVHPVERLDAIMLDPRIVVRGYQVGSGPAARRASDHRPVLAELDLPV